MPDQHPVVPENFVFPKNFAWGTATAAYQIEGAVNEDGRGRSIWDTFSHTPGMVVNGETGDVACDHYHRLDEDMDLIAGVVPHYRFSIAWPRILPNGTGEVNQKGIDFYNRLIDGLIARGVTPWVTMYHWDLPQALQDKGGWTSRDMLSWFDEYAAVLMDKFSDRVKNWVIINEPNVASWIGHGLGFHAPGIADEKSYLAAVHHFNMVIGQTFKKYKRSDLNIGSSYTLLPNPPETADTPPECVAHMDGFWNRNFFDPLMLGTYPAHLSGHIAPFVRDGDMDVIKTTLDFVGVQHYNAIEAGYDTTRIFNTFFGKKSPDTRKTDIGWTINGRDFYACLTDFKKRYGRAPIVVTENGCAFDDTVQGGKSHDTRRIDFLREYIGEMARAMDDGVNVVGYFVWSFMDNFEWSEGYRPRFGIVHVDYATQKRTPKDSYYWYKNLIQSTMIQKAA